MGIFSAPRAWWTFKAFGHDRVSVMEGGFPAWKAASLPVDTAPPSDTAMHAAAQAASSPAAAAQPPAYRAKLRTDLVRSLSDMMALASSAGEQIVDARSEGRYKGLDPEPRPTKRAGHIPGAKNVPFPMLIDDGRYKSAAEIRSIFECRGVSMDKQPVVSCGSGLTACVLALGLHQVTGQMTPLYDGSWAEWGNREDTPIEQ